MVKIILRTAQVAGTKVLVATDRGSEEWLAKKKVGVEIMLDATQPRNLKYHRKFFAFLNKVFENQDRYVDFELWRADLMIDMGYADRTITRSGEIRLHAKSISFANMDGEEFDRVYQSFVAYVCTVVIPGLDRWDLERAVMEFMG